MNVPTIAMNPKDAQVKLQAYRNQLRKRADEEYEVAVQGYQALAEGRSLLNLADAFATAGLHQDGRPKLAIARADRKQVMVRYRNNAFWFSALKNHHQITNYSGNLVISVPFQPRLAPAGQSKIVHDGFALVPMVPADVRPSGVLSGYFILWEVEQWASQSLTAVPDYDPFLLKHLTGDLYVVVAEWDLTELERAIMTGRREG